MVAIHTLSWEEVSSPDFGTPARQAWREAVATVVERAKAALPECNGRVEKAAAIVLNGDVELLPDGKAKVASQSRGTTQYFVVNGTCECRDFAKAPQGFCKHRLSVAIYKRAYALAKATLDASATDQATTQAVPAQPPAPAPPLPEAPASVNVHLELAGRQVQLTLRDSDEGRLLARLEAVLERFPLVVSSMSTQGPVEGWCSKHGVAMRQNHKDGRSWWSHKTADGWCQGR